MEISRISAVLAAIFLLAMPSTETNAASGGSAQVRVKTTPAASSGMVRFEGIPSGEIALTQDGTGSISAEVPEGQNVSSLVWVEPALVDAGYRLSQIECDDRASERRSHGDLSQNAANFEVEAGESVMCTFHLTVGNACICPKEGPWLVDNHAGSMVCTGTMSMTVPLKPDSSRGTLSINDDCTRILAEGMSEDEADLDMALQPDCSWIGTVGGEQDGIPMDITFRWNIENEHRITGNLESTVSQQGMTCRMSRTYQLDYAD